MVNSLTSISVDSDNAFYSSRDGVLFTKSLYTLIQYPLNSTATSYSIPDATVEIANKSFGDGSYAGRLRYLELGRAVATLSTMNAGYGYRDGSNNSKLNLSVADFFYISEFMNLQGTITLDADNSNFVIEGGALYNKDKTVLHLLLDRTLTSFTCANTVKIIDFGASKQLNVQKGGATTSTAISYTNGYAPREQMEQNYDKFGPWTDLYALGATLYNLLSNRRPPLPTDIDDDMTDDKHLALPLPEDVSAGMKNLILWMMQTNRMRRPQSIDELMHKLSSLWSDSSKPQNGVKDNEETIVA
jgi:serine/threonine protein kinase